MTEKKKIKIDFCDFWGGFNKANNRFYNILKKYYDIENSDKPDFLFYSCFGSEHLNYQNCVKIFTTGENVIPNFNECDYATGFDYIDFEGRYFRKNIEEPNVSIQDRSAISDDMFDRKFCNFIYSNATSGEGAVLRQEFCKKLMEYKHVDCPGKILNNMSADDLAPRYGDWWWSKINFLKKYKFTIAFENSSSNGYTTEKLFQPFQSFSIPIYWGNPLVTRDFNPKAFINCNDYDNDLDAVIERVKEIDNNPDLYLAMLRESPMQPDFDFDQGQKFEQWIINIIEKGNKPFNKDPRDWQGAPIRNTLNQQKKKIESLKVEKDSFQKQNEMLKIKTETLEKEIENVHSANETLKRELNHLKIQNKIETLSKTKIRISGKRLKIKPIQLVTQTNDFKFENRENIEWSNTWIENSTQKDKKRLLIIADSVAREFRGQISQSLDQYAIDFIGLSSSFEDSFMYNIIDAFFKNNIYKYEAILLNIGNQHGFYLKTVENKNDEARYKNAWISFVNYIKKYNQKIILLTATPNVLNDDIKTYNSQINLEIMHRNKIQIDTIKSIGAQYIDLYNFVQKNNFPYRDRQHFSGVDTQIKISEYIIQNLRTLGVIS